MWRWIVALVVMLLGVAWFVRDDGLFGGEEARAAGSGVPGGPVVVERGPASAQTDGTARPSGNQTSPAANPGAASKKGASVAGGVVPDPALKSGGSGDGAPSGAGSASAASLEAVFGEARRRSERGDAAGAETMLRKAMAGASTGWEKGRCALHLAPLVTSGTERRRLLGLAMSQGAVAGADYDGVSALLRELNRQPGASLMGLVEVGQYTVRPNDNLWTLCNKVFPEEFGTQPEVGLVQLLNGMTSDRLNVGQTLMVPRVGVRIEVDRRERGLAVYLGDVLLVAYRVGLGKENRTPPGEFVVEVKQKDPTWYRAGRAIPFGDPENILGTRWMGFENTPGATGYGIHGTHDPDSIGLDESMGCVRMRNADVEELFELIPRGTVVTIP